MVRRYASKPKRGLTIYCDWRTTYHFHSAWQCAEDWACLKYLQQFLIALCHRMAQTVFIPEWKP